MLGLLPHMREQQSGHIVNVSSIGVQTNPPRFSAYVASKAALDAFTRVVSSETIGDNVTFTTIHMPLVRTPMIAPTKMYDSFPTISPDEAADLICEAIRARPKQINTRLGTFGEVLYALAPKAVDQILHMAYKVFPESSAAKGEQDGRGAGLGRGDRARAPHARGALVTAQTRSIAAARARAARSAGAGPSSGRSSRRGRSGRPPRRTRRGRDRDRERCAYQDVIAEPVLDDDQVAVAPGPSVTIETQPWPAARDGHAVRRRVVDAGVEDVAARAEAVADRRRDRRAGR